ncbi:NAD(P)-dependent oxidoreductase [Leucobacter weissii]|uniref:NAD(P)-dependent oxidoreductase n=1 Tax=Leucobacter weissii TaxID=1983706 RepID=A0A939SCD3_9MICO|nr:NAD(P)-dependent oxidoreductase [Leucobacter weissii]MBO1902335.1 NAD(P)-dependent oxidoreductase [Leucobacter weissii]
MARIQFIGLGTMGSPMVTRLTEAGHAVWVTDANPDAVARIVAATGARAWSEPAPPDGIDVLLLMLPNSGVVEAVLGSAEEPGALASAIDPSTVVLDMSSSHPDSTTALAAMLAGRGVALVDAPVSGGPVRAASGELAIMVGGAGDDATWERVRSVLEALGTSITRTGPAGSAHALKALNNLLSVIGIVGAVEVLQVGRKFGLEPGVMLDVINQSTGRNHATQVKLAPQVLDRGWNVGFSLELTVKDVLTALGLAESQGVRVPVSEAAVQVARDALASLSGSPADQSQIAQYLETLNGVSLAR